MPEASWQDTEVLDDFFVIGRSRWPDLKKLDELVLDRSKVPQEVVTFLRSTSLNEHGIVHYVRGYLENYGDDYKLGIWAAIWGGEEYTHSLILRKCLKALGETVRADEFEGLETGRYAEGWRRYTRESKVSPLVSDRLWTLVYGVIQEYAAFVAYSTVAEACPDEPALAEILKRVAADEMRHCKFFELSLAAMAENLTPAERALVWPQFDRLFKKFDMPQEFIGLFGEREMGTDLYLRFWTPAWRSRMVVDLVHRFKPYRRWSKPEAEPSAA
jgi:hypothetical protein